MSSGSSQQPVTTTQTSDPWSGAQPHLLAAMSQAQGLVGNNTGYQPWTGQTQADPNQYFNQGWSGAYGIAAPQNAAGGPTGIQHAISLADMMMGSQGLTADQQSYVIPTLKNYATQYGDIYNKGNEIYGKGGDVYGRGTDIYGRGVDVYNEASQQQNPYLLDQLAAQDRRIGDKINSSMSGAGRYGSGAHTDVMARTLAEASYPILANDYTQRQQTRLGALGAQQGALAGQLGALGTQQGALAGQMGATEGGANVVKSISDIENQGLQTAGKFAQLMPSLEEARYGPSDRMMGLGQYYTDRDQKALNDQINLWNAQQAYPWEQLQRYTGIAQGAGGLGGTKITTSPSTAPPLSSRIMGGAIAGGGLGSMFGVPGAAAGAAGGGLLGMMG